MLIPTPPRLMAARVKIPQLGFHTIFALNTLVKMPALDAYKPLIVVSCTNTAH